MLGSIHEICALEEQNYSKGVEFSVIKKKVDMSFQTISVTMCHFNRRMLR